MWIVLTANCLLPFLLGYLIARYIWVYPLLGIAFLIIWAALAFLLHGSYKKRTVIISMHAAGALLLVCQLLSLTRNVPFLNDAVRFYFLPAMQFNIISFSRLFYLIFGQSTIEQMYCIALLYMIGAAYLGCILKEKLSKGK